MPPITRLATTLIALVASLTPLAPAQYTNVTNAAGVVVPPGLGVRGAAWADFNGDGFLDLMAPVGWGADILLFTNDGVGGFSSQIVYPGALVTDIVHQVVAADVDEDGDQDAYVCVGRGTPNLLLINQGNGTFTEEAAARGVALAADSWTASFGDYDRDGDLDLYVGNRLAFGNQPLTSGIAPDNALFRNDGSGVFTDVSAAAGVAASGFTYAACFCDFDQDGWPDIAVANDKGDGVGLPTAMMRNLGNGTFVDAAPAINANATIAGMGVTLGDIENDGDFDMFQTNITTGHTLFVWDAANQVYFPGTSWQQWATIYGLQSGATGWECLFGDYDNDTLVDLFIVHSLALNRLYRNTGSPPFADVTFTENVPLVSPGDFGGTFVDYDNDGDLDLFDPGRLTFAQLGANPGNANNWIMLNLIGTESNRDGRGALVIARTSGLEQRRYASSGEGFLCDPDPRIHFGLGTAGTVDEIEIRWPSGTVQYLDSVAANQILTVTEPRFDPGTSPLLPGSANVFTWTAPQDAGLLYAAGLTLSPAGGFPLADGRVIRVDPTDPVLALSLAPGNPFFGPSSGTMPAAGPLAITLNLPVGPLTGIPFALIGVTTSVAYPSGIKSIIGPNRFVIQ